MTTEKKLGARKSPEGARAELAAMARVHDVLEGMEVASAQRVLAWVSGKLGLGPVGVEIAMTPRAEDDAVAQLMREKHPSTNAERIAVLAFFMARQAGQGAFRTRELSRL